MAARRVSAHQVSTDVLLLLLLLAAAPVSAQVVYTVSSTLDAIDDNVNDGLCHTAANTCTLRAAVMQANPVLGADTTIQLPAGTYFLTVPQIGSNLDNSGDLNLLAPVSGNAVITITGAGAGTTIVDGNDIDRVFRIEPGRTVVISGLTVRNGKVVANAIGGGIFNAGTLTLRESAVSGNVAPDCGGIHTSGQLTMSRCAVGDNVAQGARAGGICTTGGNTDIFDSTISSNTGVAGGINNGGSLSLTNSTISGNNATLDGGGIVNYGSLFLTNSTISGNNAARDGGGIFQYSGAGAVNVYNSTIALNRADTDANGTGTAGGIYSLAEFNLLNTVVAGNARGNPPIADDCAGALTSYGQNRFGTVPAACMVSQSGSGGFSLIGSTAELAPLQDNGGPTQTHALVPPSNMIDGAEPTLGCLDKYYLALSTDQRGYVRTAGAFCDIGAFEYGSVLLPTQIFEDGFE